MILLSGTSLQISLSLDETQPSKCLILRGSNTGKEIVLSYATFGLSPEDVTFTITDLFD